MLINLYITRKVDLNRNLFDELKTKLALARANIMTIYLSLYE